MPNSFWAGFFLADQPALAQFWGPLVGPIISLVSFVCSVGNVPLAAVLWNGGISFGGVISFIFADLIILPILDIYRRYYGGRVTLYLLVVSYLAMALSGFLIAMLFQALGLAPAHHPVAVLESQPEWNYTTFLDLLFVALMAGLGWRFLRTGGPEMLRTMKMAPDEQRHLATDVVCGMTVNPETAERAVFEGTTYHFCSAGCLQTFQEHPERYAQRAGHAEDHR